MLLFVDANVFLYADDDSEPHKRARAAAWLDQLWKEETGRTSTQVLSEYYVNLKKIADPGVSGDELWARVEKYLAWNPLDIDRSVLKLARDIEKRWRISWWDAMVVAAAQIEYCSVLLTEDLQDGMVFGSVTVRNPFKFDVQESRAGYSAVARPANPHRPRGRPRRVPQSALNP